jgi:hypothetical protein
MIEAHNQLLPASTRLLQPGSRFFRMVDAFAYLDANVPSSTVQDQIKGLTNTVNSQATQIATLQGQVQTLQNQMAGIGPFMIAAVTTGVAITSGTTIFLTSLNLAAGDWDVAGAGYFQASNSAGSDDLRVGINTTSGVLPDGSNGGLAIISTTSGGLVNNLAVGPMRQNLAALTTVYLNIYANFGSGTMQVQGYLRARRIR